MPLDITVPTANGMVDGRNRLWLVKNPHIAGAADKAEKPVGCKSPHHQLPGLDG
jgi:hypothetical protein